MKRVSTRHPLLRFAGYTKPYWPKMTASVTATVIYVALAAIQIWLIGPLVGVLFQGKSLAADPTPAGAEAVGGWLTNLKDGMRAFLDALVMRPDPSETLLRLCIAIIVIALAKNVARYLQTIIVAVVQQRVVQRLRDQLFAHYHDLSMAFFARTRSGQIISRVIHDVMILNEMLDMGFNRLLRDPLLVFVLFGSLFVISWKLTLLALVVLPASMGVMALAGRFIRRYSRRAQERMADLSSILEESIGGARIVKAFRGEAHESRRFGAANSAYYGAMVKMFRVRHLNAPINEFLGTIAGVVILWYGGRAVLTGAGIAPSEFVTYIFLMFSIIQPIKSIASVHAKTSEGSAAAERVFHALDTPIDIRDAADARELKTFGNQVALEHVSFRYDTGDWVLRDIDLKILRGATVALVGPSGGGKSTLCDLLTRFYDPQEGAITVDGVDIRTYTTSSVRRLFGIVTQDVILFHETVARNIAYGESAIDMDRVRSAAEAAYAREFIEALPDGYDTVIGPRGMTLSGGQRQRLAIARAIYKDPPILIFDEATSALDMESEAVVQRAIANLLRDRTAVIVAHRLSTIRRADLIVVVEDGRIVDSGTHDTLLAADGLYRRLYDMQFAEERTGERREPTHPVL